MAKKSKWVTEDYTTKDGKTYKRYKLDKDGNKIPLEPIVETKLEEKEDRSEHFGKLKPNVLGVVLVNEEGEDGGYYKEIFSSSGKAVEELVSSAPKKELSHRQQLQKEVEENRGK